MVSNKNAEPKQSKKLGTISEIEQQLETALAGWKESLGEKKFKKRIKKAGKLFGKNLRQPEVKPKAQKKAAAKSKKKKAA